MVRGEEGVVLMGGRDGVDERKSTHPQILNTPKELSKSTMTSNHRVSHERDVYVMRGCVMAGYVRGACV